MTTPTGTPGHISLGPGWLHYAPLGTALPVDHSTALDAAYQLIGYTDEGSELSFEFSSEDVMVAESLDPVMSRLTGRSGSVSFAMAENTVRNLTLAFNGGTVASYGTAPNAGFKYVPPEPGQEVRRILVFDSEDGQERWVYPQVFQAGSVTMSRRKGATKTLLPAQFKLEKPAAGGAPFQAFYADARSGGVTV